MNMNWIGNWIGLLPLGIGLVIAPLLMGIINRVKAMFAGRDGPPLLQSYYTLWKLLHKGAVYSRTTTWVFRAGPMVGLAAIATALLLVPVGGVGATISFSGDMLLVVYLLGLARFMTVLAALDTGSPFEGMGASREVFFSAIAEPALLLGLAAVAHDTHTDSLTQMHQHITGKEWLAHGTVLLLVAAAFFVVQLAENCRIPFDDPNTHLELTMIHEVMVLDHGGPDFAFITYGATLKLWLIGSFVVGLLCPVRTGELYIDLPAAIAAQCVLAAAVGVTESIMARVRLVQVPQLLAGAVVISAFALALEYGVSK